MQGVPRERRRPRPQQPPVTGRRRTYIWPPRSKSMANCTRACAMRTRPEGRSSRCRRTNHDSDTMLVRPGKMCLSSGKVSIPVLCCVATAITSTGPMGTPCRSSRAWHVGCEEISSDQCADETRHPRSRPHPGLRPPCRPRPNQAQPDAGHGSKTARAPRLRRRMATGANANCPAEFRRPVPDDGIASRRATPETDLSLTTASI